MSTQFSPTWNNSGVDFTCIKANVIDTNSGSGSTLLDLQVNGTSKFNILKSGVVNSSGLTLSGDLLFTDATYDIGKSGATRPRDGFFSRDITVGRQFINTAYGTSITPAFSFGGGDFGIYASTFGVAFKAYGAAATVAALNSGLIITSNAVLSWSNTTSVDGTRDIVLWRDAAGTLAQRDGTNAQAFRLYETYSSSTSFGNFQIKANSGAAYQIGSAIGSAGGTNRAIDFGHWDAAGAFTRVINVSTNNRVGIGTSSPGALLDIRGTNSNIWVLGGTSSGNYADMVFGEGVNSGQYAEFLRYSNASPVANAGIFMVINRAAGGIKFVASGADTSTYSPDLKILATGLVGLGIETPTSSLHVVQAVAITGSPTALTVTEGAHTTLTASTEATAINFDLSSTKQFAAGALTTQRAFRIQAPTYSFASASTITTASTLSISGAPVAGTNATITNARALNIESGATYLGGTLTVASTSSIQGRMSFTSSASQPLYFGSKAYTASDPAIQFDWGGGGGSGIYGATGVIGFHSGGFSTFEVSGGKLTMRGSVVVSPNWYTAADAGITNGSVANTLKISNGSTGIGHCEMANLTLFNSTTPTSMKVYNTYTSATSGEYGELRWASNVLYVGSNKGSAGGSARDVAITHGGTVVANFLADRFYLGPTADSTTIGGNARGQYAVDLQLLRNNATQVANGYGAVILGGTYNTASGQTSIAGGYACTATVESAVAIGNQCSSTGDYSFTTNQSNNASVGKGFAHGLYAAANRCEGMYAHASGRFAANGDAQFGRWILRATTTNATSTALLAGFSRNSRLSVSSGKTMSCKVTVKGIKSDGSAKARFVRLVEITNVGGTTALDMSPEALGTDYNPSGCVCDITADNTNDALDISVTGITGETWRWVAVIEGLEIAYGT